MGVTNSPSLRDRQRLTAMKRVQAIAVERFTVDGFDAVTVEQIAAAAEVSAMSVYRWFGTKEGLVIWDEFDPPILAGIGERLADRPPLDAVRDALVALLDDVYDRERELALARTRLIVQEPALRAASNANGRLLRGALAAVLVDTTDLSNVASSAVAATAVALLEVAIERWQQDDGRQRLATVIADTFAALTRVTSAAQRS